MLIAIDIGNTNISIGLFHQSSLLKSWRAQTNVRATVDEYANFILAVFARDGFQIKSVKAVVVVSVVPILNQVFSQLFVQILQKPVDILQEDNIPVVDNLYNRQELGIDRLVNAYAGFQKYKQSLIIIDFGTAVTFDIVGARGEYLGGVIIPSMCVAAEALSNKTAKLPKVDFQVPKKIIGKNTIESMHSGMFFGYIGMINFCIKKIFEEQGHTSLVIATGGDANLLKKYSNIDSIEQDLSLWGIERIYQLKKNK